MSLLNPQLEAFQAIVRAETVHGAARIIGITQTGVTQRIRALEAELSTTLFIRSRKGMRLTPEGQALLRYCQAARDLEGEALSKISGAATQSEIRIQITGPTSLLTSRVVPQCEPLMKKYPNLLFRFQVNDEDSRVEELRSGRAQFALVSPMQVAREMDSKLLKPEKYILVASSRWKNRGLSEILERERMIDFGPDDQMTLSYLKLFKLSARIRVERHFVNNNDALIQLFTNASGYGVLTREVASPHIESGALTVLNQGRAFENRMALAWYPRPEMPQYFRALKDAIH